jgi:hypothetical protein
VTDRSLWRVSWLQITSNLGLNATKTESSIFDILKLFQHDTIYYHYYHHHHHHYYYRLFTAAKHSYKEIEFFSLLIILILLLSLLLFCEKQESNQTNCAEYMSYRVNMLEGMVHRLVGGGALWSLTSKSHKEVRNPCTHKKPHNTTQSHSCR